MQTKTKRDLQVLRRVHDYLGRRAPKLTIGDLQAQTEALGGIVDRLTQHAGEQDVRDRAAQSRTRAKQVLMTKLRVVYMRPITRLATAIFPTDGELRKALTTPGPVDDEKLLAAAYGMADRASQFEKYLIAAGFAPDFLARMRETTDACREAITRRSAELGLRSASTTGLLDELRRGRQVVQLIDAMLAPALETQPDQLAEWRSIARFVRKGARTVVPEDTGDGAALTPAPLAGDKAA